MLEWRRYNDYQRLRLAPRPVWPDRQMFVPSVWRYLDLRTPLKRTHLYCPYEYARWRNISPISQSRCQ